MWPFISLVNLIRYLIVWKVNSSLAQLPRCFSAALSQVLGTIIARRLPARQAREWRKALLAWEGAASAELSEESEMSVVNPLSSVTPPDVTWPIEAVLFPYPGKRAYGYGEPILWELKLLGDSADHGLFLEWILPAMEEAATTTDPQWRRANNLWGHFDIYAIYVARSAHWEPLVSDGQLDTRYRPSPAQWAEGLTFSPHSERLFRHLTWVTPFDLGEPPEGLADGAPSAEEAVSGAAPALRALLDALMERMTLFLPGKRLTARDAWALVSSDEQAAITEALAQAELERAALKPAPKGWPGRWIGLQTFSAIPSALLPYLELASILHVGRHTHFGCGTFTLT